MTAPLAMAPDPLAALAEPARWLLTRVAPDEPAMAFVRPDLALEQLFDTWMQQEQVPSAIRLLAGVMPSRESVWWAWVSARHATQMVGGAAPTAAAHKAIAAVEQWIVRPDDDARRAAWDAGNAAGLDTPIGMVSAAVFLSGATVGPSSLPAVPPPPGVVPPLVAGVVTLAAAANADAELVGPTLAAFAAQGLEIIKRLGGWDAALASAYERHQRAVVEYERVTKSPTAK